MSTELIPCEYRYEGNRCRVLEAFRNLPFHISPVFCERACGGPTDKEAMMERLSAQFGQPLRLVDTISADDCRAIVAAGGFVAAVASGEIIYRRGPMQQVTRRYELPAVMTEAGNLLHTGRAVARKLLADAKHGTLWQGLAGVKACAEQVAGRENICATCQQRQIVKGRERCVSFPGGKAGCGCYLKKKRTLAAARCDQGYWDDWDRQFTTGEQHA